MTRTSIAGAATVSLPAAAAVAFAVLPFFRSRAGSSSPELGTGAPGATLTARSEGDVREFLHGRVTTHGGTTDRGRLRWGGDEEASWSDHADGFQDANPWAGSVPPGRLPTERRSLEIFGFEIGARERAIDLRLEARGDLGDGNAGLLVFGDDDGRPGHAPWRDVARIDLTTPSGGDELLEHQASSGG